MVIVATDTKQRSNDMKALDVLKSPIVEIGSDSDLNLHSKAVVLFATREQIQDAIAELEALQQPKNCDWCKYEHKDAYSLPCAACVRSCDSDYYET